MHRTIVFCGDKYIHKTGVRSQWEHSLFASLGRSSFGCSSVWLDKCQVTALAKRGDSNISFVVFSLHTDPSIEQEYKGFSAPEIEFVRSALSCKVVGIFGDLHAAEQLRFCNSLEKILDVIIYTGLYRPALSCLALSKSIYMFPPIEPHKHIKVEQTNEVGFVGRPRKNRVRFLQSLIKAGLAINSMGGEREANLTYERYRENIESSLISLSFSRFNGRQVCNARPFEILGGHSVLLEQIGIEILAFFTPYVDFVPFLSARDALKKINRLRRNPDLRKKMVENSKRAREMFSDELFWTTVFLRDSTRFIPSFEKTRYCSFFERLYYLLLFTIAYMQKSRASYFIVLGIVLARRGFSRLMMRVRPGNRCQI